MVNGVLLRKSRLTRPRVSLEASKDDTAKKWHEGQVFPRTKGTHGIFTTQLSLVQTSIHSTIDLGLKTAVVSSVRQ